ncbi:MAG: hypothetical protein WBK48_00975 [Dethiobacteria bacterium]
MTEKQRAAYEKIRSFLDNCPPLDLPEDLKNYLVEHTEHLGTETTNEILANMKKSIENPDEFLADKGVHRTVFGL